MLNKTTAQSDVSDAVIIKKYANRRLYNTETSTYVTLEDLAQMVRSDRDFVVRDAKTGDDLTHSVLTQIIVEQEGRSDGPTMLPIPFLRQLIRYYGDSVGKFVPGYLQFSLEALTKEQERFRSQFMANPWSGGAFEAYQDQARRNLAIFEQAMSMWAPFNPGTGKRPEPEAKPEPGTTTEASSPPHKPASAEGQSAGSSGVVPEKSDPAPKEAKATNEIEQLKAELAAMQRRIESLSRGGN